MNDYDSCYIWHLIIYYVTNKETLTAYKMKIEDSMQVEMMWSRLYFIFMILLLHLQPSIYLCS